MSRGRVALALGIAVLGSASGAGAIPQLQIYIDNAVYDAASETWVTVAEDFDVWVIGDVDAEGTIRGTTLTVSYSGVAGTLSLVPTTTSRITDPSTPAAIALSGTGTGGHPVLSPHGVFNDPSLHHWEDYSIGDLSLHDSPVGDFSGDMPFPVSFPDHGQVNVYAAHVSGWNRVHFDAYGYTLDSKDRRKDCFAPYSHDGEFAIVPVAVQQQTWSAAKELYR